MTAWSYIIEKAWIAWPLRPTAPLRVVKNTRSVIEEWSRRRWYRADLRRLRKVGDYMIADIGLDHTEALLESEKPFWRA